MASKSLLRILRDLRLPRPRVHPVRRMVLYSGILAAALGYSSFRWIWSHPRQVEIRLEEALSRALRGGVRVEGAGVHRGGGVRARQIDVDAPRTSSGTRGLARLREVHVDTSSVECDGAGGAATPSRPSAASAGRRCVVCSASLALEHDAAVSANDREVDWSSGWNVDGLFDQDVFAALLSGEGFDAEVRRLELDWQILRAGGRKSTLRVEARDARVEARDGGVWFEARLPQCASWAAGRIEANWVPGISWQLSGRFENLVAGDVGGRDVGGRDERRRVDEWLPFLPQSIATLWQRVDPRGVTTLEVRRCGWRARSAVGDATTGAGGEFELDVLWRHFDSTMRVPRLGAEIVSVRGLARLGLDALDWGDAAGLTPARGEIWGQECRVSGRVVSSSEGARAPVDSRLTLEIVDGTLSGLAPGLSPLAQILRELRPRGALSGRLAIDTRATSTRVCEAALVVAALSFPGFPVLSCERLEWRDLIVSERPAPGASVASGAHDASASIDVRGLDWKGFGRFDGTLQMRWDEHALRVETSDWESWRARDEPGDARSDDEGARARGTIGRVRGHASRAHADGRWEVAAEWDGIAIATRVLESDAISGKVESASPSAAVAATRGTGSVELGAGTVPANIAGEASYRFARGRGGIAFDGDGIAIERLELEGDDWALRARGALRWDGSLDIVVVRADHDRRAQLLALPPNAPPSAWLLEDPPAESSPASAASAREKPPAPASESGARDEPPAPEPDSCPTAFRISGTLAAPLSRPIQRSDPAFSRSAAPADEPERGGR